MEDNTIKTMKNKHDNIMEKSKSVKKLKVLLCVIAFAIVCIAALFFSEEYGGVFDNILIFSVVIGFWMLIAFLVNIRQSKTPKLPKKVQKRLEEENKTEGSANWKS